MQQMKRLLFHYETTFLILLSDITVFSRLLQDMSETLLMKLNPLMEDEKVIRKSFSIRSNNFCNTNVLEYMM